MAANLNEPRTALPRLHKGAAITQSFVQGIAAALNGNRGVSRPVGQNMPRMRKR